MILNQCRRRYAVRTDRFCFASGKLYQDYTERCKGSAFPLNGKFVCPLCGTEMLPSFEDDIKSDEKFEDDIKSDEKFMETI